VDAAERALFSSGAKGEELEHHSGSICARACMHTHIYTYTKYISSNGKNVSWRKKKFLNFFQIHNNYKYAAERFDMSRFICESTTTQWSCNPSTEYK